MRPNLSLPPFILLSTLTTWISGTLAQPTSADLFSTCGNLFTCGETIRISYPFWGSNRPVACGYPELELKCDNNITRIVLSNVNYRFLGIYPDTRSMKLVREDYSSGSICSPVLTNSTFDPSVFGVTNGYTNFTFLYGCPTDSASTTTNQFACNISGVPNAGGYILPGEIGPGTCFASVFFPVPQSFVTGFNTSHFILSRELQQGFEIGLNVDFTACVSCNQSKGVCGYDQATNRTTCYCSDGSTSAIGTCAMGTQGQTDSKVKTSIARVLMATVLPLGVSAVVGILLFVCISRCVRGKCWTRRRKNGHKEDVDAMIRSQGLTFPRRYKYRHLKKLTRSFSEKLGEGGYGEVYKGKLREDGRLVAVKILKDSKGNGMEFINEVASISRTAHINIVELLGFCYEGKKRALLYDYMPNGSLDKFLPKSTDQGSSNCPLGWKVFHRIAVGIARGLEYLHQGCNTRILHFDIKPQNILLDHDFTPKISDFGLAKLCQGRDSIVSMLGMRGTIGYIAPEVFSRNFGAVSHKSDVYSYGMLLFEVINCKDRTRLEASRSGEMYFPDWVYNHLESGEAMWMSEINSPEDEEIVRKMMLISLWCIQTNPSDRPSMSKVIEMMEGSVELLRLPPKPALSSPLGLASNGGTTTISSSVQLSSSTLLIGTL